VGHLEVLDADGRVKHKNDVAFLEEGEVSPTVSREHARIVWDEAEGEYRLRDDGSASGTRLLREGRSLEVSGHDRRGVRLRSGDQLYFGRASVKVTLRLPRMGEGSERN
jgi:pSer/pThr/pTyr-binding forkhead associated (FHA) protein